MPALAPPSAPYAYVVEYRALDQCAPPTCAYKSRDLFGWVDELQPDGERGSNLILGKHGGEYTEVFFHRGKLLAAGDAFSFELPQGTWTSELDVYLGAIEENHDYRAEITFEEARPLAPYRVLGSETVAGHSAYIGRSPPDGFGMERKAYAHVRRPIPSRDGRGIRITIKNTGNEPLGLGNPLVMKRVDRAPRQVVWAIYDAVPFPIWDHLILGPNGEPKVSWLSQLIAKNGTYFQGGFTPGLVTTCYSRRVLRGDYYNDIGEPMVSRNPTESPPEITRNVIASLAEQGVQTYAFGGNFTIIPSYSYLGFDGGYNDEAPDHPFAVANRMSDWATEHPNDDTFVISWIASTHLPWPSTPATTPMPTPPGLTPSDVWGGVLDPIWANAVVATDLLGRSLNALRAASPAASRMIYLSADHGRGFTKHHESRAFRSPMTGAWPGGMSHGGAADAEEMRAPFSIIYEGTGSEAHPPGGVNKDDVSILAAMRAVERFYGVQLDLPDTRVFDDKAFTSDDSVAGRWDDELFAGLGLARTFRFVRGPWDYSEYTPRLDVVPLWEKAAPIQRMLMGTPFRSGPFVAEELYDRRTDPYDFHNVAGDNVEAVLSMRKRATDWFATYYDGAGHGRYRYTLTFGAKVTVTITAPRPFDAFVDGKAVSMRTARSVDVTGSRVEIQEKEETVGVIEVRGALVRKPLLLRCAANGLPVDQTSAERPRLNMALGRTNCPVPKTEDVKAMPDSVMFSFEPARANLGQAATATQGGGGVINQDELMAGMKKWGYVRDIEKKP